MPRQSVFDMSYGNPSASIVLIQMVDDHDLGGIESEAAEIKKLTDADFHLIAVRVQNWNRDLSPWPAPAVFGKEGFGNGAADMLNEVLKICTNQEKTYFIGGYSLAGLFALWAAYQTDVFKGVAAASPSMWFPGLMVCSGSRGSMQPWNGIRGITSRMRTYEPRKHLPG